MYHFAPLLLAVVDRPHIVGPRNIRNKGPLLVWDQYAAAVAKCQQPIRFVQSPSIELSNNRSGKKEPNL